MSRIWSGQLAMQSYPSFKGAFVVMTSSDSLRPSSIADGFRVNRTRAGADGGVDLLAGRGAHGFDPPRICVQVKSGKSPEDVKTVRELQGALKNFGAEHGLIVSWSGYTAAVYAEARRAFFQIRLWDADDVIDALLKSYEELPA
jgi:restriction system protein